MRGKKDEQKAEPEKEALSMSSLALWSSVASQTEVSVPGLALSLPKSPLRLTEQQ